MSKCPYCGGELAKELDIPRMSKRQKRIYNAVCSASNEGIFPADLVDRMYEGEKKTPGCMIRMRVEINTINKKIGRLGQRIKGGRATGYFLIEK